MATENELKAIIKKERGGNWIEYFGPFKIGAATVWEIWTWTNENKKDKYEWTPQTRWWLEDENSSKIYFAYFADLAPYLDKRKSASLAPSELTIGQLISGLKTSELVAVIATACIAAGFIFWLGARLGHFFGL